MPAVGRFRMLAGLSVWVVKQECRRWWLEAGLFRLEDGRGVVLESD